MDTVRTAYKKDSQNPRSDVAAETAAALAAATLVFLEHTLPIQGGSFMLPSW